MVFYGVHQIEEQDLISPEMGTIQGNFQGPN